MTKRLWSSGHLRRSLAVVHRPSMIHRRAPITVMIASDRQALLLAWLGTLMQAPEIHAEPLTDPARLSYSIEQKSPAVLLLDKAMLDRLDGGSIQAIGTRFGNTR